VSAGKGIYPENVEKGGISSKKINGNETIDMRVKLGIIES